MFKTLISRKCVLASEVQEGVIKRGQRCIKSSGRVSAWWLGMKGQRFREKKTPTMWGFVCVGARGNLAYWNMLKSVILCLGATHALCHFRQFCVVPVCFLYEPRQFYVWMQAISSNFRQILCLAPDKLLYESVWIQGISYVISGNFVLFQTVFYITPGNSLCGCKPFSVISMLFQAICCVVPDSFLY